MMSAEMTPRLSLVVTRGPDEGARLDIDDRLRVIGRARDADLVLSDLSVSRRHLDVQVVDGGVRVRTLPETTPFVFAHQPAREAVVPLGAGVTVGASVLCVLPRPTPEQHVTRIERTEARTLLQGAAIEVKGLAAVAALMAAFDDVSRRQKLEEVLASWGHLHADAARTTLLVEDDPNDALACDGHRDAPDDVVVREVNGESSVTVPAHAQSRAWLTFYFDRPSTAIGDAQRRLLLVAGRICASCLGRVHALDAMASQLRDVRQIAIGSARAFLGTSPAAEKLAMMIPRVASSDAGVLIQGETGAGKSFVARLIHEASARSREPLRVINCASIPESLLESELFGHDKGAFTGATSAREGAFESVGRGTLFLDEIGELPLASQAKLLRALEERKFERLGSNRSLELRARIVCATNRELTAMAKSGRFRSDLLFRISVITLRIPPLRERGDDLVLLAKQIFSDLVATAGRKVDGFSDEAIEAIRRYAWPGNVRELRNAIEHAIVLGQERTIMLDELPDAVAAVVLPRLSVPQDALTNVQLPCALDVLEKAAIDAALAATKGNRTKAAVLLGINRATLYNKLRLDPRVTSDED